MGLLQDLISNAQNTSLVKNLSKWPEFIGQYGAGRAVQALGTGLTAPHLGVGEALGAEGTFPGYGEPTAEQSTYTPLPVGSGGSLSGGGAPTGGNGGGYDPTADGQTDQAGDAKTSEMNAILARLNMMRDTAGRLRSNAGGVRDELMGDIKNRYGGMAQSLVNKTGVALDTLGQEDTNTQNLYSRAGGDARRAMNSALTRNRVIARALNRGDSSFYNDQQAATTRSGATGVADVAQEEAGKRAAIGTRKTETKNWQVEQEAQIEGEKATLENQAQREYSDAMAAADDLEKSTGISTYEEAAAAEQRYQSRLSQIQNYVQDKAIRLAEIAATTGASPVNANITNFSAISPKLASALGSNNTGSIISKISSAVPTFGAGAAQSTDPNMLLGLNADQGQGYEDILRRLGLLRA